MIFSALPWTFLCCRLTYLNIVIGQLPQVPSDTHDAIYVRLKESSILVLTKQSLSVTVICRAGRDD